MNRTSLILRAASATLAFTFLLGCQETREPATEAEPAVAAGAEIWPSVDSKVEKDPAIEARIDELLSKMSVEQKVGQMIQPEIRHVTPEDVKEYHLGSVLNGGGSTPDNDKYASLQDWVTMADGFWNASMEEGEGYLAIPIMWGTDAVHGLGNVVGATLFPHNIGLGAAHNPDLLEQIGEVTAREIAATGLDWNFSPTVAVARDDRWGRTYEAWSEDPELVGAYAGRMVEGLQGEPGSDEFLSEKQVIATAKHYIGDGGTRNGVDRGETAATEEQLRDIHGAGYFSALESGVQAVMASFTSWDGTRMHGHKYLLTDVLKDQMNFDGLVVGDWSGHSFVAGCTSVDCPQAVNAGLDIFMAAEPNWKELFRNTVEQAKSGVIPMERIDDAVRRILRVKLRAGLFERGAPSTRVLAADKSILGAPEHRAVARQAVRESLVMLKNADNLLPLSPQTDVLVAGDGADNIGKQAGGWSVTWQGTGNTNQDFPGATSIYEGIAQAVEQAGGTATLSEDGSFTDKPDVAIVVFGEDPYAEMQGDRLNLMYSARDESDLELLRRLQAEGIPVVSVFLTGRPLWVNREINASDAFVVAWLPGTEGQGVADVLFTKANGEINYDMTGRLSFSWPDDPTQVPLNRGDKDYDPLFPYGYGLSYGDESDVGKLSEEGAITGEAEERLSIFNRRPVEPWNLMIEGNENDRQAMSGSELSVSTVSVSAADRNVQADARRVQWNGEGVGTVALSAEQRQDLTGYLDADSALVFDVNVHSAPTAPVWLRLGCGSYCASDLNFTDLFAQLADKGWETVSVALNCFPESGDNFGARMPPEEFFAAVQEPFSLVTDGSLDLTFADVHIVRGAGPDAQFSCD